MVTIYVSEKLPTEKSDSLADKPKLISYSGFSPFIENFLNSFEKNLKIEADVNQPKIKVSQVLGSLALLYEKIRNAVEYKGEHVLRRSAIERILKRLLWERPRADSVKISKALIRELILARYLPNDTIVQEKIHEVAKVIDKYLTLLDSLSDKSLKTRQINIRDWVWGVAASEIEDALDPSNRELYVKLMYEWFTSSFKWQDEQISEHEKNIQIYLAIHRALTKSDEPIMRYHLLLYEYPTWVDADERKVEELVNNFSKIYQEIEKHLAYPQKYALYRRVQRNVAPFEILKELAKKKGSELRNVIASKKRFEKEIIGLCDAKYDQIQKRVNRGIVRSILYIFVTKILIALLVEIPYEIYRFGDLRYLSLGINIIMPPALMWVVGLSIRTPGDDNTKTIVEKLKNVVYRATSAKVTEFSVYTLRRASFLTKIFGGLYALLFLLVFGGITYLLLKLNFTLLGIAIFFAFLSLILLFAFRVRFNATELRVTSEEEGFFGHIFNNLTLPFLNLGFYLSRGLAKLNFFTVIFDFLIEAPLKTIIEVVEEWTSFIKEKREEVVELPE